MKIPVLSFVALISLAACNAAPPAQGVRTFSGDLSGRSDQPIAAIVAKYLGRDAAELKAVSTSTGTGGLVHVTLQQEVGGVRIVGATVKATAKPTGELTHVIDATVPVAGAIASPRLGATDALLAAMAGRGLDVSVVPPVSSVAGNVTTFEAVGQLSDAPTVERVAFALAAGRLQGGFLVQTWTLDNVLVHSLVDDAGQVVSTELRTNNDSYNVFTEDPLKTPQAVVAGPGAGNVESPAGWLSGSQTTINITGNNANAYLDADGNNRPDRGGTAVSTGDFLTAADLTVSPTTTNNRSVAVQNLFYLNNVVHDVLYRHGFTEAAGNFQNSNFGKGGAERDAVRAEAQDGSGTDNANFSTPSDGQPPRMQMYLWTGRGDTHEVVVSAPAGAAGTYGASGAEFGSALSTTGVSGAFALVNDGTGTTTDGCEAIAGSLSGKIALIDRGTCAFTVKVLNAQGAGAAGVIVINNDAAHPDDTFTMGGTERKARIPAAMVSYNTGGLLKANLAGLSGTERKKAVQPLQIDGDVDSDIVFHEYGHGLTWRMIGGMSGPLAGAIGEGASDTVAFLIDGDDRVGEYAWGKPEGIRRYPYSGYPLTYGAVTGAEVHDDGEIYAAAMWRLNELFLASGGTSDELLDLFVAGMNYTPSTPRYEDMRDGMLAADAARGGARSCLVWQAFAQYGIGVGAQGVVNSSTSVTITESFAKPASCP